MKIRVIVTNWCYFLAFWLLFCGMVAWGIGTGKHAETPQLRMPVHQPDIAEMIVLASVETGLPSHIGITQGWIESRFTNAFSEAGELGPLQVKAVVAMARGYNLVALLEPQNSIRVGVAWLKEIVATVQSGNTCRVFIGKDKVGRFRPVRCAWENFPPTEADMEELKQTIRSSGHLAGAVDFAELICDSAPTDELAYELAAALHRADKATEN